MRRPLARDRFAIPLAVGAIMGALLLGSLAVLAPTALRLAILGLVVGLAAAAAIGSIAGRVTLATSIVWLGLLAPLAVDELTNQADVAALTLSPVQIFRGTAPLVCLLLALIVRPMVPRQTTLAERLLLAFGALAVVSTLWSLSSSATFLKAADLLAAYLLLMLLVRIHRETGQDSLASLAGVIHGIVVLSIVEIAIVPSHAITTLPYDPTPRLVGVFPAVASNLLAFVAGAGFILLLGNVAPRWMRLVPVRVALMILDITTILLTRTRIELLLLVVGVLILLSQWVSRRPAVLMLIAACVGVGLGMAGVAGSQLADFLQRGQTADQLSSLSGRTGVWSTALDLWTANPLGGLGYYAGHRLAIVTIPGGVEFSNIDNMWLEALVDTGLLGAVLLGSTVVAGGVTLSRRVDAGLARNWTVRRTLFTVCFLASFINPSLQTFTYSTIIFFIVLAGTPRPQTSGDLPHPASKPRLLSRRQVLGASELPSIPVRPR